jgi:hypothetical protein
MPDNAEDAVDLARRGALASASALVARKEGRWWRVLQARLDERPEEWADDAEAWEEDPFEIEEEVPF